MKNDWKKEFEIYESERKAYPFIASMEFTHLEEIIDHQKSSTVQQCVEILSKMRKPELEDYDEDYNPYRDEIVNKTLDEAITAIKKQFGIKE